MAILKKQFSKSEVSMGNEDWHYLARDSETGRAFVSHEWSHRHGEGYQSGDEDIDLDVFLGRRGTVPDRLRQLIGTLVTEKPGPAC